MHSPPCSIFQCGDTLGKSDSKHSDDTKLKSIQIDQDSRKYRGLIFEYLRVIEEIKPKVIIGENVTGLQQNETKIKTK